MKVPRSVLRQFPQVKTVVNSRTGAVVTVTNKDCARGRRKVSAECALAQAAIRQWNATGALIGMTFSYIIKGDKAIRYETSEPIGREITSFDRHGDFATGSYRLSPVSASRRTGAKRARKPHTGGRDTSRIVHRRTVRIREVVQ